MKGEKGLVEQASRKSVKEGITLSDQMRVTFKGILDPIAAFLNRLGLMPNTVTVLGLVGNIIGAIFIAAGQIQVGGIIVVLMGPVDALDGTMARLRGMAGKFGAFVDSVTDRYSELVIYMGLIYYYTQQGDKTALLLVFAAAAGSVLVSYVRARGQSLGWDTKIGILTRMERYLVLAPALILNIPIVGLWILAVLANITAIQRIVDVRRQFYQEQSNTKQAGEK
jgi:CDP-diacylglycerol--glycerol-3-phosphate 3-phosphatidyltransferase